MKNSIITLFSIVLFASFAAVGCDLLNSDSDLGSSEVQMQMQVQSATLSTAEQLMAGQPLMDYEIQEVKLFVEEMELESVSDDSSDFEDENFIVNLSLDGSVVNISNVIFNRASTMSSISKYCKLLIFVKI